MRKPRGSIEQSRKHQNSNQAHANFHQTSHVNGSLGHENESFSSGPKSQESAAKSQSKNGLSRHSKASDGYILTENSYGQLHLAQRLNSSEDEEKIKSRDAIRQKSKEMHQKSKEMQQRLRERQGGVRSKKQSNAATSEANSSSASLSAPASINSKGGKERRIKHILLSPEYRFLSGNETSGVEICQKLFGITVFEYSNGKADRQHVYRDRKLVVQGVIEGSKAFLSGNISRGDMLIRINDVDVSWRNFTQLLKAQHKREVRLTFQSPKIIGPKSSYTVLQVPEADLCLATLGKRLAHIQEELIHCNCVAMYLTLTQATNDTELDQMEDVVYAFPPGEEVLTALRGLFITLSSALMDVVGQPAIRSHLQLNNSEVHVAYKQCGRDVLVFVMPGNRISASSLENVLNSFSSLLVLLFGDFQSVFQDCDRVWLDKLIALMFHCALQLPSSRLQSGLVQYPRLASMLTSNPYSVRLLGLPNKDKLLCDEILNEFESMDFDDYLNDAELFLRRKYVIRGTSLYYKGLLITTHLQEEQQRDVNLFLNCHNLLSLSSWQEVNQVFVWHEFKQYASQNTRISFPVGYKPCVTRSFLMVVGLHYYYLAVLIDAGWSPHDSQDQQARPLPLLVDQGRATLEQLQTDEVHMSQCCEESLTNTNLDVALGNPDHLCVHHSPRNRLASRDLAASSKSSSSNAKLPLTSTKMANDAQVFARSKSVDRMDERDFSSQQEANLMMRRHGSKHSYGSNDSGGSGSSGPSKQSKGSRVSSTTDLTSISRSLSVVYIDKGMATIGRLTRGHDNGLFSYVHLDDNAGILVAPTDSQVLEQHSGLQAEVLDNFAVACHRLKCFLNFSSKDFEDGDEKTKATFLSCVDRKETSIKEAGTLFSCSFQSSHDKRQICSLSYWVVGRVVESPRPQLLFVCFHESADQCMVETAFSLGFGT
ncbi:protein inturned-like [Plakobranchus ocellatus]|uniref:Protein inturned n=1 Tax=Plakobranchus ocellatus TaxID=259542 RepID=A0AAV3YF99_9GAST|nr:protein inturned-like [Plakobranchus ocellatus]